MTQILFCIATLAACISTAVGSHSYYFASNGNATTSFSLLLAIDNKNALDHNLSMKTEWRITFRRGDFIRFDSKKDIGSIENIFVHEVPATTVKETRDNSGQWEPRDSLFVYWYRWRYLGIWEQWALAMQELETSFTIYFYFF
jgi:hypothetical protein